MRLFFRVLTATLSLLVMTTSAFAQIGFRQVTHTYPVAVQRGTEAEVKLHSNYTLDGTYKVFFARGDMSMTYAEEKPKAAARRGRSSAGTPFRFKVTVPANELTGIYEYRIATDQAVSSVAQMMVTDYPVQLESDSKKNNEISGAESAQLPVALCGMCERFEDVDHYAFRLEEGQHLIAQIYAQRVTEKIHGMVVRGPRIYLMDPILTLYDPDGRQVSQNDNFFGGDSLIDFEAKVAGDYVLQVRDARYAGDGRYTYCVELSDAPFATAVFPLAVQKASEIEIHPIGPNIHGDSMVSLDESMDMELGWNRVRLDVDGRLTNPVWIRQSAHPETTESEPNDSREQAMALSVPCGMSGMIEVAGDKDVYRFNATKGQQYRFEVEARRYGSPLDSVLDIQDKTGKRLVEVDDVKNQKDSSISFTAPGDGEYTLSIGDVHDRGGPRYVYHLDVELATPDFEVSGEYYYAFLAPGTRMTWFVRIDRRNGFNEPVAIEVENLPEGVTATPVTIPTGMNHCAVILSAEKDAKINASLARVRGKALVQRDGNPHELVRFGQVTCEQQSSGGGQARWPIETQLVGVTAPLDLKSVIATPERVTLKRGSKVEIKVAIERNKGATPPVTLEMAFSYFKTKFGEQLPPGVTMSAKSKTRLAGKVLEGLIILEATDKALAVKDFPVTVVTRVPITFSITTNYASNPVLLTVE